MGTSNSYGGQKGGALIPSWLGGGNADSSDGAVGQSDGGNPAVGVNGTPDVPPAPPARPTPAPIPGDQFQIPRGNFTSFAKSGGNDRKKLGRAISGYVSSSVGGSHQAAQRMGSSKTAGARLAGFLSSARSQGVRQALRALRLENLAGRPIEEIFLGLADYVCPEGGTVDEGIARNAFIETIVDLAEFGITDLDSLTVDQMQTVLELYATHAIEARLCNDIGTKINIAPANVQAFERVQALLHDFILRGVSDALTQARAGLGALTPDRTLQFVGHIYERAFSILQTLGEQEAQSS
ncbi:MAG: hypothetical protein K2Q17_07860 [Nitrospiraceae bacterium]|nr:hypothetical protein [Nitrospiraceae bacterium]